MYTIGDFARINASRSPCKKALIQGDRALSYSELDRMADQLAAYLLRLGARAGDRVGLLAYNSIEFVIIIQAVARIGAILVPYNSRHNKTEMAFQTAHCTPVMAFAERDLAETLRAAFAELEHACPLLVIEDCLSSGAIVALTVDDPPPAVPVRFDIDARSPAAIMYTSGSSGRPKGVVTSHENYIRIFTGVAIEFDMEEEDIVHAAMPFFHNGGFASVLCPALMIGATVVCAHGPFDTAAVLRDIERHRVTIAHFIPTMLERVVAYAEQSAYNTQTLRKIHYGAMPTPTALLARARKVFSAQFYQFFASTDAGLIGCLRPEDHDRDPPATARPIFSTMARIVDNAGNDVPIGETGEVLIDSKTSGMMGYWNDAEATAEVIRDGWIATGDIARKLDDGFFAILDRRNFMIISGGENIYPTEIERAIQDHPDIVDVAVVGAPDPQFGQLVCAFVVLRPGTSMSLEQLRDHCAVMLARYKLPRKMHVLDELPRTGPGKIAKAQLVAMAAHAMSD